MMKSESTLLEGHLINAETQNTLHDEYKSKNYATINATRDDNAPDSLICSFDTALLREYLDYAESVAAHQNVQNTRVEICMGQYPANMSDRRLVEIYRGYQTVFLRIANSEGEKLEAAQGLNFGSIQPPYR